MNARILLLTACLVGCLVLATAALAGAPDAFDESDPPEAYPLEPLEPAEPSGSLDAVPTDPAPAILAGPPAVEIPPFKAIYDVKMRGVVVGELEVSLAKGDGEEWIYRQASSAKGVAALFGPEDLVETSRFRRVGDQIEVLEYRSKRKGGDADDNARFVFDHAAGRVDSVGKGEPWSVEAPKGVVDPLLMTLAMRFELAAQKIGTGAEATTAPRFSYSVPRQGRIKTYEFGVVGVENVEVTGRSLSAVHVQRLRDKKDQTSIWTAPEMDYLPVRILKTRSEGSSSDVVLRSFVRP